MPPARYALVSVWVDCCRELWYDGSVGFGRCFSNGAVCDGIRLSDRYFRVFVRPPPSDSKMDCARRSIRAAEGDVKLNSGRRAPDTGCMDATAPE
jgi:hypothetical protein